MGRPYLAASSDIRTDDRTSRVIDSSIHLIDHMHEVPAMVIPLRLDRPPSGKTMRVLEVVGGDRYCLVYGASSSARARGLGSTWTTFHLAHEAKIAGASWYPING